MAGSGFLSGFLDLGAARLNQNSSKAIARCLLLAGSPPTQLASSVLEPFLDGPLLDESLLDGPLFDGPLLDRPFLDGPFSNRSRRSRRRICSKLRLHASVYSSPCIAHIKSKFKRQPKTKTPASAQVTCGPLQEELGQFPMTFLLLYFFDFVFNPITCVCKDR